MADAAKGGAGGFRHSDGGGPQREGVCGEGLQTCGEDYCVSAHTQSYFIRAFLCNGSVMFE